MAWLLFVVYVLNFVERQILIILMEPIRLEFGFSDQQLGLCTTGLFAGNSGCQELRPRSTPRQR